MDGHLKSVDSSFKSKPREESSRKKGEKRKQGRKRKKSPTGKEVRDNNYRVGGIKLNFK